MGGSLNLTNYSFFIARKESVSGRNLLAQLSLSYEPPTVSGKGRSGWIILDF